MSRLDSKAHPPQKKKKQEYRVFGDIHSLKCGWESIYFALVQGRHLVISFNINVSYVSELLEGLVKWY